MSTSPPLVAVLGAGAAGLLAAIHAATAGARVVLLERTADGGRKILISGGGR
ncbi:MAG TPA: NAD(P)/FAD-dependent oxidoreductase, partial [Gemmatimonadales bacterium]|nr:NAD(P)/FAD-dependent oxidoreductase [Gemmatimonadales bacterium]